MYKNNKLQLIEKIIIDDINRSFLLLKPSEFDSYSRHLHEITMPYIGDSELQEEYLKKRYINELFKITLAWQIFKKLLNQFDTSNLSEFYDQTAGGEFYRWYEPSEEIYGKINEWIRNNSIIDLAGTISLITENNNEGTIRRKLGEYYTPDEIGKQLCKLLDFNGVEIARKKIIDPTCGTGNLLRIVIDSVTKAVQEKKLLPEDALTGINNNLFGYDIQPYAIVMTKIQLMVACIPILLAYNPKPEACLLDFLKFNLLIIDPIREKTTTDTFDFVIANPPFLKIKKTDVFKEANFAGILNGQPNLYQLFLWWAIESLKTGGRIAIILPQAIMSGQYLNNLRKEIHNHCQIKAIKHFSKYDELFDSVDQKILLLSLLKNANPTLTDKITIINSEDAYSKENILEINQDTIKITSEGNIIWCISDTRDEYRIIQKVFLKGKELNQIEELKLVNGGFVWNQNKLALFQNATENSIPLISSDSIHPNLFRFPPESERTNGRLFVNTEKHQKPMFTSPSILIKRTTPMKRKGRRIIACLVPEIFIKQYPRYYCENHLNVITMPELNRIDLLFGLMIYLNSKLFNFVFCSINGSSHVSKYELSMLPYPYQLICDLSENKKHMAIDFNEMDILIYKYFNLNKKEIDIINLKIK